MMGSLISLIDKLVLVGAWPVLFISSTGQWMLHRVKCRVPSRFFELGWCCALADVNVLF